MVGAVSLTVKANVSALGVERLSLAVTVILRVRSKPAGG